MKTLIEKFKEGLSIGSYLSQNLANYYLSYAYNFASNKLFENINTRLGIKQKRLISHCLFYMDDILFISGNKRDLLKSVVIFNKYINDELGLELKDITNVMKVRYINKKGNIRGNYIDMIGYKMSRNNTILRKYLYKRFNRKFHKIRKRLNNKRRISLHNCQSCISSIGWIKPTKCIKIKLNTCLYNKIIKKSISYMHKSGYNMISINFDKINRRIA